jgi:hypothetical protein
MQSLENIQQQIRALPHRYIFYTKKEIRSLPDILGEREKILALTSGYMQGNTWLCVCTDQRLLFLDRGMFFGLRQVQMNLDRIQSIDASGAIFFGSIRVWDGASSIEVRMVLKSSIQPFVRTVQEAMDRYKRLMVQDMAHNIHTAHHIVKSQQATSPSSEDWVAELERLSQLHKEGHLSDKEFQSAKRKLLAERSA